MNKVLPFIIDSGFVTLYIDNKLISVLAKDNFVEKFRLVETITAQ